MGNLGQIALTHRTLTNTRTRQAVDLGWQEARALAEAIFDATSQGPRVVAAYGWIVRLSGGIVEISKSGWHAMLTKADAFELGKDLAQVRRQALRIAR
jgi:hypothetical protein